MLLSLHCCRSSVSCVETRRPTRQHTNTFGLCSNRPIFPVLLQVRPVYKRKCLGIVVTELLQAGSPSCHPTNSVKTLKDDKSSWLGTTCCHHAAKEHCNGCVVCLAYRLQGDIPPVIMTVPDLETACWHHAVMVTQEHCCVVKFLQAGCPYCHPVNSVEALTTL